MSRELKFRAWDGEKLHAVMSLLGTNFCKVPKKAYPYSEQITVKDVMQFTGVVDINGTEIYEGDIIRIDDNTNWADEFVEIAEVCFIDYCWMLKYIKSIAIINPDYFNEFADTNYYKLEVVGNIYENKYMI